MYTCERNTEGARHGNKSSVRDRACAHEGVESELGGVGRDERKRAVAGEAEAAALESDVDEGIGCEVAERLLEAPHAALEACHAAGDITVYPIARQTTARPCGIGGRPVAQSNRWLEDHILLWGLGLNRWLLARWGVRSVVARALDSELEHQIALLRPPGLPIEVGDDQADELDEG